ncbi:hypothetical protein GSI_06652 [Ganoderma sinense ZZ0214-1]|uniref:Transporter n=1 Tax=Ganoderma sinense ZZ0214-1 TaxID=1077348 RepID=A0A2G8SEE6_9APHY|nr:hypothetical protein GSI_06652 [Ganoderma sinense ZZ0214-1]
MLSTTHLLLVLLGIAVLLAGVYVISFPPEGDRGIDIGAWTEGDPPTELLSTAETDIEANEEVFEDESLPTEDEPLPMEDETRPESPHSCTQTQAGLGLHVITEPPTPIPAPQVSVSPILPSPTGTSSRSHPRRHGREQTDSALLASPPRRSRSSAEELHHILSSDAHSGATTGRRRRRTTMEANSSLSPGTLIGQHPLSPSGSGLGGFSIGLSPLSPGFSIVPRERRRRTTPLSVSGSGAGLGLSNSMHSSFGAAGASLVASSTTSPVGGVDDHSHSQRHSQRGRQAEGGLRLPPRAASWKMRRVVSEGDAERQRRRTVPAGQEGLPYGTDRDLERDAAQGEDSEGGEAQDRDAQTYGRGGRRAKGRWKWLQTVVERVVRGGAEEAR